MIIEKRKNLHIKVKAIIIRLMPAIIKRKACSNTCIAGSYILGTVVVSSRALFLIFETDFSITIYSVSSLVGWLCSCRSALRGSSCLAPTLMLGAPPECQSIGIASFPNLQVLVTFPGSSMSLHKFGHC